MRIILTGAKLLVTSIEVPLHYFSVIQDTAGKLNVKHGLKMMQTEPKHHPKTVSRY